MGFWEIMIPDIYYRCFIPDFSGLRATPDQTSIGLIYNID